MTTIPQEVIQRFATKKTSSLDDARSVFLKLELFLSASCSASGSVPTLEVDEAWHEFILHTKQYADYCSQKFGRFIHHVPGSPTASVGVGRAHCNSKAMGSVWRAIGYFWDAIGIQFEQFGASGRGPKE